MELLSNWRPFESHIMDFGPQSTLVRKITKDQLAGNRGKAILCVSRLALRNLRVFKLVAFCVMF